MESCKDCPDAEKPSADCPCGRKAESLCSCKFPGLPLLPLCSQCSIQHFTTERGDHHQLPAQAWQFVTSVSSFREAVIRITKYEIVKRKLESNAQIAIHSEQLLTEAAGQIISKIEKIKEAGLAALKQTRQAVVLGKDKIVETMEKQLFEAAPYFPNTEETDLFHFELGLEEVERALEHFAQVPKSRYDMDLSDIMKKEEKPSAPPISTPLPIPSVSHAAKGHLKSKPRSGRRNRLEILKNYVLPPNKSFKCARHRDIFWTAKALVKHLRAKHEKFVPEMMPSEGD